MQNTLVGLTFAVVFLGGSLRDCAHLTRFEQESYDCSATQAPFEKLTFQRIDIGETGSIAGAEPASALITDFSEDRLVAEWGRDRLTLSRKSGVVTLTKKGLLRSYACNRAQFQM